MFDFRQITLFVLGYRLSKHKMTICSKHFGGHGPVSPRGYAYLMNHFQLLYIYQTTTVNAR